MYGLSTLRVVLRYLLHRLRIRRSPKLKARRPAPLSAVAMTPRRGAAAPWSGVAISVDHAVRRSSRGVDLAEVGDILRTANPGWLALMLGGIVVDLMIRGLRWQRLLAPIHPVPYRRSLGYLLIGYLANNVLPARLGELVRAHYLGDREGVSRTTTLGTIVVERVIDTVVVVAIAALAIVILGVRGLVANAVIVGLAVTALLVVALDGPRRGPPAAGRRAGRRLGRALAAGLRRRRQAARRAGRRRPAADARRGDPPELLRLGRHDRRVRRGRPGARASS